MIEPLGCLSKTYAHLSLPVIYGALYNTSQGHWNASVEALAKNVLKIYMDYDEEIFNKVSLTYTYIIDAHEGQCGGTHTAFHSL
jgi:hypothetical protein